jgi:hypothetical protein
MDNRVIKGHLRDAAVFHYGRLNFALHMNLLHAGQFECVQTLVSFSCF